MAGSRAKAVANTFLVGALLLLLLISVPPPLAAQVIAYPVMTSDTVALFPVPDDGIDVGTKQLRPAQTEPKLHDIATYGPFRVLDANHVALVDVTDADSPDAFAALLRDHPDINTIEMVDCPGTEDGRANLRLGRMIRAHGMTVHVPDDGFMGSGAVDLFLAGAHRIVEPDAAFAVHSWRDILGREPRDYPPDSPQNRSYLDYYRDMGLSASQAKDFYAMTNSVPFSGVKRLTRAEMAMWVNLDSMSTAPQGAR